MSILSKQLKESIAELAKHQEDPKLRHKVVKGIGMCISPEYEDNLLFVYGSLRKDEYNYHRIRNHFGKEAFFYISDTYINSAMLYDLGDYPAIVTGAFSSKVIGEVMYCSDEAFKFIKNMELGAGYKKERVLIWLSTSYNIISSSFMSTYVADKLLTSVIAESKQENLVKSGDWIEYSRKTQELV